MEYTHKNKKLELQT